VDIGSLHGNSRSNSAGALSGAKLRILKSSVSGMNLSGGTFRPAFSGGTKKPPGSLAAFGCSIVR